MVDNTLVNKRQTELIVNSINFYCIMHFSSRSYSYGGLLRLGEHQISTTTLIKSFSGLANDLKLSKFWLTYI